MKKHLLLFLLLCFAGMTTTHAQTYRNLQDVVYLHNGSVIKGIIVEQVPNELIKIQTWDGNILVYKMDEVSKLTKEAISRNEYARREMIPTPRNKEERKSGYFGTAEIGYGFGIGKYKASRVSLGIVNGYMVNYFFAAGLGVGMNYYHKDNVANMPIYAHFKSYFLSSNITPYGSLDIGYNIGFNGSGVGGFMINPSVGIALKVSNNNSITFSIGYQAHSVKWTSILPADTGSRWDDKEFCSGGLCGVTIERKMIGAINLKLGVTF